MLARSALPRAAGVEAVIGHGEMGRRAGGHRLGRRRRARRRLELGGPVARVFIGSRSSKIVRHSPVPVVVVPREASTRVGP